MKAFAQSLFLEPPEILKFLFNIYPGLDFFLYHLLVFFSSLAMIYHLPSIVFAFGNFHFWPYGKNGHLSYPQN